MTPKIPNPRSKPRKFGMEKKIQEKIKSKCHLTSLSMINEMRICVLNERLNKYPYNMLSRGYEKYNYVFELISNKDIYNTLNEYAIKNKLKTIRILDEGTGKGYFLNELKKMWKEKKNPIKLETNAIVLEKSEIEKKRGINKIYAGDIIKYIPDKKFDYIFSIFGATAYSMAEIEKEILLKHLYSLKKGGIGIFSLFESRKEIIEKKNIIDALKKRGFNARLVDYSNDVKQNYLDKINLPILYLVVEREK